jgi:hypothetical protein
MILSGSVKKTYSSGHGGGGGGSEVAGAGETGDSGEERVLGARDGDVGVDITRAAGGGEESGPGGVSGEEVVLGARAGAKSGIPTGCIAGS